MNTDEVLSIKTESEEQGTIADPSLAEQQEQVTFKIYEKLNRLMMKLQKQ